MTVVRFSVDDGFDFAVRCLLNGVPYRMADPEETIAVAANLEPGDFDGWYTALTELGARHEAIAEACDRAGHRVSAVQAYLRAANYRYAGFWYILDTKHADDWAQAWRRTAPAWTPPWRAGRARPQHLDVPWSGNAGSTRGCSHRPHRARAAAPARLLVVQEGLGAPLSDSLMTGVVDAVERGWYAIAFDGPGQGRAASTTGWHRSTTGDK